MKKEFLILVVLTFFISVNVFADSIMKPIEDYHENNGRVIAPHDINADEETKTNLPGLFNDISLGGEEGKENEVKPKGHRSFTYGYHRTLESLTDIGNGKKNIEHVEEMLKSEQVVAFINAAQTQPAAAAGLHYGLMNSQLTLVNQQLSHQGFFQQMQQLPDGAQLLQSMYTNCIYPAIEKGSSFAKAQTDCIGDKATASGGSEKAQIANAKNIPDHDKATTKAKLQEKEEDKILCTDLIFKQQESSDVEDFKKDMIKWVGDEETIINAATDQKAAAAFGKKRIAPETPLVDKFQETLYWRYEDMKELMESYCEGHYNEGSGSKNKLTNLIGETKSNFWAKGGEIDKKVGLLSIEGYDFNTLYAEAMLKTYYSKVGGTEGKKIDCQVWVNDCGKIYEIGTDGRQEYNAKAAADSPIAKECKFMYDYAEGVALGHVIEALARVKNIVLEFTAASQDSDARACGMRIIYDQIKTRNLEAVQYEAIKHLIKTGNTIITEISKESGTKAASGSMTVSGTKNKTR